ncbi:MAG: sugar phosphate isomerase/epimerase, partial [Armatimonadetes bacterium]|nr:sugar phosphate isomerase/epimerase [Armatimonadota bacterium]
MLLGCVTYNVLRDMDLETVIKTLEATGYDAVELRTTHRHGVEPGLSAEERRQVRGRFGRSGVRLLSYGTTCEFQSPEAAERRRQVETGRQFVDLAHDTGAWGVKVRPNGFPEGAPRAETVKRIATALGELGEYGEGRGVEIWLEVHGKGTEEPAVCAEILRATGHRSVGICWNSNPADVVDGSV